MTNDSYKLYNLFRISVLKFWALIENMQLFFFFNHLISATNWKSSRSLDRKRSAHAWLADVGTVKPHREVRACSLTIVFGRVREAGSLSLSAFM